MPNKEYWIERQIDLQNSLFDKAENYTAEIEKGYNAAIREFERQISVWYQRFADNNEVDMVTAQRLLNNSELEELKWDVKEYIKHGEENAIDGRWIKELENASARVHISRLEALKLQTRQCIEQLYGGREQAVRELLGDTYTGSLYGTGYEHFCRTGIETYFDKIDQNKVNQILNKPWTVDGRNFSERIWGNKQQLINVLNNEFTRAFTTGESPDKTIKSISQKLDADMKSTRKLVMTESAYFATKGQEDCYDSLDVEEYEIFGTLDSIICEECGGYDGKHYPVKNMRAGINAPPFHPHCRCTTIPYFNDEFTEGEQRAARDEDGTATYVPDMTFEEWKEKFVDNDAGNDIIKAEENNMSLEYQRYGRNKNTLVNSTYINSGEYRNKFDKITDNKDVNRVLYVKAKEMLEHRSGTMLEDMYWIDGDTGDIIASVTDSATESRVIYSNALKKAIQGSSSLITAHTHPQSMPPSVSDFNSAYFHKYKKSMVICHDGKIFGYTSNQLINEKLYDIYLGQFVSEGLTEYEAQIKTLEKLQYSYDIDFWEVK